MKGYELGFRTQEVGKLTESKGSFTHITQVSHAKKIQEVKGRYAASSSEDRGRYSLSSQELGENF